jgi:hypothetical protein
MILLLSLPNKVWGNYCFCSVSSYYFYYSFFPRSMNLSTADLRNCRKEFDKTWWSYRYMFLIDPNFFRFVVKGVKAPHFYAVFWQPFWKCQTSWKFWKHRIAPLMVTYHSVKLYVSIIIQLEVINIKVREELQERIW